MSGRADDPRAGHPNGDSSEMPADLAAVQADDLLLDMLGSAAGTPGDADGELTRVLAAWRREVHADSNRLLVDTDTAVAVISAARRPTRRRSPIFGPIAAAAAVFVIAFSAMGLLAKSAQPGDNLWGVTEVLYSDYARSVETAASVRTELEQAKKALQEDKPEKARESLDRIRQQLPVIAEAEGKADLTTQRDELERKLVAGPPAPDSPPGSPDTSSSRQRRPGPFAPSDSATNPSPSPDPTTPSEPTPSPEPTSTPSPAPEQTPSPAPKPPYPNPVTPEPSPSPEPTTPPEPAEQPTQPNAQPIRTPPSDFTPPAPPSRPAPPAPPKPPSGTLTDHDPSGPGDSVEPGQPRSAGVGQSPSSATIASAYPLQYSQLT